MKFIYALAGLFLSSAATQAADFPELYCVSNQGFEQVNQINLFTNKKGTMRISLQFYATDGENEGNFDSGILQTITRLQFDAATGLIANGADKVQFQLDSRALTPAQAQKLFQERGAHTYDLLNLPGHKIEFKRYYAGKMLDYNLPGRKGYWTQDLMKAFRAGVTDYVCGKVQDVKGARPSIFDGAED